MARMRTVWWLGYLVSICIFTAGCVEITDFLSSNVLSDGEIETRIHYRGVCAKETAVAKGHSHGLRFRQLTDGRHFIQLIYDDLDAIRDCEYIRDKGQIQSFLATFKQDLRYLLATSNVTVESLDNKPLPSSVSGWLNYAKLRDLCKKKHRELKRALQIEKMSHNSTVIENERKSKIRGREKRALLFPGTVWCGVSDAAYRYTDLGKMDKTDKCCRKHDNCKMNILPFQKRFNYVNKSPITVSHCFCDSSFRACLKMVDTSDANLVGKIFFDIVQTKCFVLKPKKVCVKHSWWGKCMKRKYTKQAIIRDNPRFK